MAVPAFRPEGIPPGSAAEIDEWASRRPAPRARTNAEIRTSLAAIWRLSHCGEPRIEALGKGALHAVRWVGGHYPHAPATGREIAHANTYEVSAEIEAAGQAAAGVREFPTASYCDEGRIAARGVEEWLAWCYLTAYPPPLWLDVAVPLETICLLVLGRVGAVAPGLIGPGISTERFPYDVADVLAEIT